MQKNNKRMFRPYMLTALTCFVVLGCSHCNCAIAQTKTVGSLESLSSEFDRLVAPTAKLEVLASGFTWTEGPVWVGGENGHLLFSDIPRNTIFKYSPEDAKLGAGQGISVFMKPSG